MRGPYADNDKSGVAAAVAIRAAAASACARAFEDRVVARDLRGERIQKAVAEALANAAG